MPIEIGEFLGEHWEPLEGFALAVDPIGHRLVPLSRLPAL